ncbi:hypothetical protein COMNV_00310 [Commensalibacter sp. Nvir]|uniref:SixA phosphatase family protein n=1 Tax=Commensalibacter sp. Nvir TaxID=3069817 RepID=UPI002D3E16AB|nr:hypothetical protein COMNV_00310 [Commensalibacter sp. Nvir]
MTHETYTLNLYLLRHGKAVEDFANDFDRPLTPRGREQAKEKGQLLKKIVRSLNLIVCSPSSRTRETLDYLNINHFQSRVYFFKELYLATSDDLIKSIQNFKNTNSMLIIGHNPALHCLSHLFLSSSYSSSENPTKLTSFPTAALAHFSLNIQNCHELNIRQSNLIAFYP